MAVTDIIRILGAVALEPGQQLGGVEKCRFAAFYIIAQTGTLMSPGICKMLPFARIKVDITGKSEKIIGLVHNVTFKTSLKQVSMPAVSSIEIYRIGGKLTPHEF
jgi:hypothetical protein